MLLLETPYLESHWLSTILESVFAIFIFLLGIPLLFVHAPIPEELREIYNKKFKDIYFKKIRHFIIWIVSFILIFSNHLIKDIIENYCTTCLKPIWFFIYNIVTLFAFLLFFFDVLVYLRSVFFNKLSHLALLLDIISSEIRITKKITPELINDLQSICDGVKDPNARQKFLDRLNTIIDDYLSSFNMDDSILEELTYKILVDAAIENSTFHNERDLKRIYSINDNIIEKNLILNKNFNCRASIDCLREIARLCISQQRHELLYACLATMFKKIESFEQINELCLLSLKLGNSIPSANYASQYLKKYFSSNDPMEKDISMFISMTLFSWLNLEVNEFTKKYVNDELSKIIGSGQLTKNDIQKIIASYYDSNDFLSAKATNELLKTFFK